MQLKLFFRTRLSPLPSGTIEEARGKRSCWRATAQLLLLSGTVPSSPTMTQQSRAYLSLAREPEKKPVTKQLIFALLSLSLHLVLVRSEFTVTIERSQCDSTGRDLHRQYQKYQKAMLIKILLSSAEVIHLCFWKPSVCCHCSIPFTVVEVGIKVTQNGKKRHNSIRAIREN